MGKKFAIHTVVTIHRTRWVKADSMELAKKDWHETNCEDSEYDRDDCCEHEELDSIEEIV